MLMHDLMHGWRQLPDYLLTFYLLIYFPLSHLWRSLHPAPAKPRLPPLPSYWRQGRFVLMLLAAFVFAAWSGQHSADALGLGWPRSPGGAWGLAIAGALLLVLYIVGKVMEARASPEERARQQDKMRDKLPDMPFVFPGTRLETVACLVAMVGMVATWEILFRGYLLLVLTPFTGMPVAVVLAATVYGAAHGYQSPKQFFGSIAASLAFTVGYALTGSLWWLIVLHAAAPVTMLYTVRSLGPARNANSEVAV